MKISGTIVALAKQEAKKIENFNSPSKKKGEGNRRSNAFVQNLRQKIRKKFGKTVIPEQRVLPGKAKYAFDYYIPTEKTVIEIALSLHNSNTEFEKDIFKAILAKENKLKLDRLLFLCKAGGSDRMSEKGPLAIREYVNSKYHLAIEIIDIS